MDREREPDAATGRGFLADLPRDAERLLLSDAIVLDVPAGGVVYREDEEPRLFVVRRGVVRVFVSAPDGRQATFRYARPGDVMGLASVLGGPSPVTMQALTAASIAAPRVATLRLLLKADPDVARACARELSRQLYQALDDIASSSFQTVRQRIARHLLALAEPAGDGPPAVSAGRQVLADAVGSAREVVTRTLAEMRADGLVGLGRERIVLLDPERLGDEAQGVGWSNPAGRADSAKRADPAERADPAKRADPPGRAGGG